MTTTIILARWVVPVQSEGAHQGPISTLRNSDLVIPHGAVVVKENKILAVGTAQDIRKEFELTENTEVVDLSQNHILIPGLINCHTHCAMSLLRGYADDLPLQTWLQKYIWPTERQIMSDEYVYEGTAIAAVEAIKSGTTMLNDMYFLPELSIKAMKEAGLRSVLGISVLDFGDGTMEKQIEESFQFINKYLPSNQGSKAPDELVRPSFIPHSLYTVDESYHSRGVKELLDKNVTYHTHLHETTAEREQYETKTGKTAVQSLFDAGALGERFIGAHCVHLTNDEIQLLAKTKSNVCHCPKSNLKLGSGFCPVVKLIEAGVNVCLGTDGGCSNNSLDMLSEMQFAALLAKGVSKNSAAVDAYTALKMATRNGAKALGRLHDLGSIEVGKLADIVAVDLVGHDDLGHPIYDPISHLVYTTHREVTDVWVNGKRIMANGSIRTIILDFKRLDSLIEKISQIREEIISAKSDNSQSTITTTTSE